ncbi:hypothetical protein D3C76_1174690 [compost metagenome]
MDGAAVAFEQLGLGQQVATGADTAQWQVLAGQLAQPVDQRAAATATVDRVGADHQQRIQLGRVGDAVVGQYPHAVAGDHGRLVRGNQHAAKQWLARGQVGHTQGFHRRGQADGGEVGQNQKAEGLYGTTLYNRRRQVCRSGVDHCAVPVQAEAEFVRGRKKYSLAWFLLL